MWIILLDTQIDKDIQQIILFIPTGNAAYLILI